MSPDEITLVESAKKVGYEFRYRSNNKIEIKINGKKKVFTLFNIFKFTSERKRMTVVVQDPEDPDYVIAFTKGADNVMKHISYEEFQSHFDFKAINKFATKGYRTLLVGMKVIRYDEYMQWKAVYDELVNDMENDNEDDIKELVASIEKELFLLGTTALEDKLQENVHECIEEFRRADIKVWMITGDKLETAENVGISCRLLQEDAERFFFTAKDEKTAHKVAVNTYLTMKRLVKSKQANPDQVESEKSSIEKSADFERASENLPEVAEEHKAYDNTRNNKNLNSSFYTQQNTQTANQMMSKKATFREQYSTSDLYSKEKRLKISEKKLFVRQMIMSSSMNTSFNPNRIKHCPESDLNFEIVIEGE